MNQLDQNAAVDVLGPAAPVAGILLQTLFFKFTGAEESVYIFTAVHAEPWGRIGSGVIELVAAVLLLVPVHGPARRHPHAGLDDGRDPESSDGSRHLREG